MGTKEELKVIDNTFTFDEWLLKYFGLPTYEKVYKSKGDPKIWTEKQLLKKYKKAYHNKHTVK